MNVYRSVEELVSRVGSTIGLILLCIVFSVVVLCGWVVDFVKEEYDAYNRHLELKHRNKSKHKKH